jgi:hypothetical protein
MRAGPQMTVGGRGRCTLIEQRRVRWAPIGIGIVFELRQRRIVRCMKAWLANGKVGTDMPFCPTCRYEYKPGILTCPDCETPLVESLPEPAVPPEGGDASNSYEGWVALARLTSPQYVDMLEEVFRDKNIPVVMLRGAGLFEATGQMGITSFQPAGGGYTVRVPEEYVREADSLGVSILGEDWVKARLVDIEGID